MVRRGCPHLTRRNRRPLETAVGEDHDKNRREEVSPTRNLLQKRVTRSPRESKPRNHEQRQRDELRHRKELNNARPEPHAQGIQEA